MNPIFAAGLFENPWVVAVIIIVGALINWLSQRRQAKRQQEDQPEEGAPPSPNKSQGEFNMEETLRRLLGEETPPPLPAPPPIPRAPPGGRPPPPPVWHGGPTTQPVRTWIDDSAETASRTTPALLPPPVIAVARPGVASFAVAQTSEQAAVRFEQLNEQGRHPAKALDLRRRHRPRTGARATLWRDRQSVRRAFVASLVFGPPKGLEP